MGLLKVAVGAEPVPLAVLQHRRDICRDCPRATRSDKPKFAVNKGLTNLSRCLECNCFVSAKTKLAGQSCPLGKW